MITKSDWRAANHELMADDRRRVGEPPTAEEILAYSRGELSAEKEARVRERLVCHPELLRTLTEPFPTEGASPGDADYMTDEEFGRHWETLRKKMQRSKPQGGRLLQFWRASTALAAALALLFGALLWRASARVAEPRVVWDQQVLFPDGRRGLSGQLPRLTAQGESVLLITPLIGQRHFDRYRLAIVDADSDRSLWRSAELRPSQDDAFAIVVPRRFLRPGVYRVEVYGIAAGEERLATYTVRVPAQ